MVGKILDRPFTHSIVQQMVTCNPVISCILTDSNTFEMKLTSSAPGGRMHTLRAPAVIEILSCLTAVSAMYLVSLERENKQLHGDTRLAYRREALLDLRPKNSDINKSDIVWCVLSCL